MKKERERELEKEKDSQRERKRYLIVQLTMPLSVKDPLIILQGINREKRKKENY